MRVRCRVVLPKEEAVIENVVRVANDAYRCQPGTSRSWTNEGHLIVGDRISREQILRDLSSSDNRLVVCEDGESGEVVGSVMASRKGDDRVSIGLLNVNVDKQNFGAGKELISFAESLFDVKWAEMCVLAKRTELIAYYKRRGYEQVEGAKESFPIGQGSLYSFSFC